MSEIQSTAKKLNDIAMGCLLSGVEKVDTLDPNECKLILVTAKTYLNCANIIVNDEKVRKNKKEEDQKVNDQ